MGRCDFACDRRIDVVVTHATPHCRNYLETSRHHKVRRLYAVRTHCILLDTPMIKIICHSIASDTLWVRKVRHRYAVKTLHTPNVRDRYSYRIDIAHHAIKLRSCYVHAASALLSFLRRTCDVCMAIEAATNVWRSF